MLDQRWRVAGIQMIQCPTFECVCVHVCYCHCLVQMCTIMYNNYHYYDIVLDQGLSDSK